MCCIQIFYKGEEKKIQENNTNENENNKRKNRKEKPIEIKKNYNITYRVCKLYIILLKQV